MTENEGPHRPLLALAKSRVPLVSVLLVLALTLAWARRLWDPNEPTLVQWNGQTMGTTFQVKVAARAQTRNEYEEVARSLEETLRRINAHMSTYLPESELSRFNGHASMAPFKVSSDTLAVVRDALRISESTRGAFDVTVAPAVVAWGFGANASEKEPTPAELSALRERIGYHLLAFDEKRSELRKLNPAVTCDLSAIAKGFAVEEVAAVLERHGYDAYLVEIGGEVKARGRNVKGEPWRVGIEQPTHEARMARSVLNLDGYGIATSGSYRNYRQSRAGRITHIIDPRTLRPVTHRLVSVSVIHRKTMTADGWATALFVLGPEEGYRVAAANDIAALLIFEASDGKLVERVTPAWLSATRAR